MNPMLIISTALSAVGTNRLRSSLTLLGIVIGVSAVITLMAIGKGSQATITDRLASMGADLLYVSPSQSADGTTNELTFGDAIALEDEELAPDIAEVAAETNASAQLVAGSNETRASVLGITANYLDVRDYELATGRPISSADIINATDVAVLGSELAETLFPGQNPVNQTVRLDGREFSVVGVLESIGGRGQEDNQAFVPITTAQMRLTDEDKSGPDAFIDQIAVQTMSRESVAAAEQQIRLVLSLRQGSGFDPEDAAFTVTNQVDLIETMEETTQTFVIFLGAIAGISLLVGGIGIMNIMLVSVTERTREIGIQRAIGATRKVILSLFVAEATVLSIGGGVLGVLLGTGLSAMVNGASFGSMSMTTQLSGGVAALALGVAAAIGLVAGIYPAARAAALDPIEALRHE